MRLALFALIVISLFGYLLWPMSNPQPTLLSLEPVVEQFQLSLPKEAPLPINHADKNTYLVNSSEQLYSALNALNVSTSGGEIILSPGLYSLNKTLQIHAQNITIRSISNDPTEVVLKGVGMHPTKAVTNLIWVGANDFVLQGVTLREAGNHLIQIAAEQGADRPTIRYSILEDGYEQLLKVTQADHAASLGSSGGLIEYNIFRFTKGIAPNYYTGGIDAHGVHNWVIRHNLFYNIASPGQQVAEYAVHLWRGSSNNVVEENLIFDCDRGIGFGMGNASPEKNLHYGNSRGVIRNNLIFHNDNAHPYADVGISLESSPGTTVSGNNLLLLHNYRASIEVRYPSSKHVLLHDNKSNRPIWLRDGALAEIDNDNHSFDMNEFLASANNLFEKISRQ